MAPVQLDCCSLLPPAPQQIKRVTLVAALVFMVYGGLVSSWQWSGAEHLVDAQIKTNGITQLPSELSPTLLKGCASCDLVPCGYCQEGCSPSNCTYESAVDKPGEMERNRCAAVDRVQNVGQMPPNCRVMSNADKDGTVSGIEVEKHVGEMEDGKAADSARILPLVAELKSKGDSVERQLTKAAEDAEAASNEHSGAVAGLEGVLEAARGDKSSAASALEEKEADNAALNGKVAALEAMVSQLQLQLADRTVKHSKLVAKVDPDKDEVGSRSEAEKHVRAIEEGTTADKRLHDKRLGDEMEKDDWIRGYVAQKPLKCVGDAVEHKAVPTLADVAQALKSVKNDQTVFMVGDSTMRHQFNGWCKLLEGASLDWKSSNPTSGHTVLVCRGKHMVVAYLAEGQGGWQGGWQSMNAYWKIKSTVGSDATLMYFNGGLHFLHMMPARSWVLTGAGYDNWLKAEHKVQSFMNNTQVAFQRAKHADDSHPQTLKMVFMTTHSVCEDRFNGLYAEVVQKLTKSKWEASRPCAEWLMSHHGVSKQQAHDRCADAFFVRDSAKKLNDRCIVMD